VNEAAKLHPGWQEAGNLITMVAAPTRIFSKLAWQKGVGAALEPAVTQSLKGYAEIGRLPRMASAMRV
jgi:hypothetical protein